MQGRPPIINTEEEAIIWYINLYYKRLGEEPDIRFEEKEHIKLIEGVDKEYKRALRKRENFNYELFEGRFIECIDFLTKVFTKKKEKLLSKPVNTI